MAGGTFRVATADKEKRRVGRRIVRACLRLAAAGLVVWVVWQAGWNDRVRTPDGRTHTGRVIAVEGNEVRLATSDGETRLVVDGPKAVRYGLRQPLATLRRRPWLLVAGVLLQLGGILVSFVRWGGLLAGAGLAVRRGVLMRLGFLGQFFAAVLPGGAGAGDIVKAFYVARHHASAATRAVLTVVLDRMVGIVVLSLIAVAGALGAPPGSRLADARFALLGCVALGGAGCALVFSTRLRARLGVDWLLARLPFRGVVEEVHAAIALYATRPGVLAKAAGITLVSQAFTLGALAVFGSAFGEPFSMTAALVAVPVATLVSAVPGLPGGWGVGDAAFFYFLPAAGVAPAQALAVSFCYRGVQTLLALPGGLWIAGVKR